MRHAEGLRSGPGLERRTTFPNRVGREQGVVLGFRPSEQVELDKARHLVEMAVARHPDLLEGGLRSLGHAKTVHGDEHQEAPLHGWPSGPDLSQKRTSRSWL